MATHKRMVLVCVLTIMLLALVHVGAAQGECSRTSPCRDSNNCCSQFGYCGTGSAYCGNGCQAGPCSGGTPPTPPSPGGSGLSAVLTRSLYQQLFPHHLSFFSYEALIEAAKSFPQFGTTGDENTKKREIAAFAAHVWQETSGLQVITEQTSDPYCDSTRPEYPCNGHHFNGRGPLQLSWNYNYGAASKYLHIDILSNPDLVAQDAVVSFMTSLWFWNEYGDNVIPHIHDVMTGKWSPHPADQNANRKPGFGVTILIINGNLECNKDSAEANNRVNFYKHFCSEMGVDPGSNLDCRNMKPFYGVLVDTL